MKHTPILFKPWKVKRILEWDFDQSEMHTRRLVKQEVREMRDVAPASPVVAYKGGWVRPYEWSPYGRIGDLLWVKESYRFFGWGEYGNDWAVEYRDGTQIWYGEPEDITEEQAVRWWIDCSEDCQQAGVPMDGDMYVFDEEHPCPTRWRSSLFLPKWAARIWLQIVDLRVERLQAITRDDAKAEGVSSLWHWDNDRYKKHPEHFVRSVLNPYVANFSVLWDSINKADGTRWDDNPWVWVIAFRRVKSPLYVQEGE